MTKISGGVIWNPTRGIVVVNQNNNSWSLPKGHVEKNETDIEAALREIKEETGIEKDELNFVSPLPSYEREQIKKHAHDEGEMRTITFFFFTTQEERLQPEDPENPKAIWVRPEDVASALSHPIDKIFFDQILRDVLIPYREKMAASLFP